MEMTEFEEIAKIQAEYNALRIDTIDLFDKVLKNLNQLATTRKFPIEVKLLLLRAETSLLDGEYSKARAHLEELVDLAF